VLCLHTFAALCAHFHIFINFHKFSHVRQVINYSTAMWLRHPKRESHMAQPLDPTLVNYSKYANYSNYSKFAAGKFRHLFPWPVLLWPASAGACLWQAAPGNAYPSLLGNAYPILPGIIRIKSQYLSDILKYFQFQSQKKSMNQIKFLSTSVNTTFVVLVLFCSYWSYYSAWWSVLCACWGEVGGWCNWMREICPQE